MSPSCEYRNLLQEKKSEFITDISMLNATVFKVVIFNFNLSFSSFIVFSYCTKNRYGKNEERIVYGGYCYRRERDPTAKITGMLKKYWRRVRSSDTILKCYARVCTEDGIVVQQIGYHIHKPE